MITVIGSLNYDLVTFTDRVPSGGETIQANSFENHLGGKGLNEAVACARLSSPDTKVRMIGKIGGDAFGKQLKQELVDSGVDTEFVSTVPDISSGVAVILVESDGENRILIIAGANGELRPTPEDYEEYFPVKGQSNHFFLLQNEYPDTIKSIDWVKENRPEINICYNPSPYKHELINAKLLSNIDLLILNEGEALDVAGSLLSKEELDAFKQKISSNKIAGIQELCTQLQGMIHQNNISTVIITLGSLGCVFKSSGDVQFHAAQKVHHVVDTTGAGDTFFGGVVVKLSEQHSLADAISFGTLASSLVIQGKGAAESIPFLADPRLQASKA